MFVCSDKISFDLYKNKFFVLFDLLNTTMQIFFNINVQFLLIKFLDHIYSVLETYVLSKNSPN